MRIPSWKISVLSQALEPGSLPPTSPWCAVVHVKPISSSPRWTGLKTKMSCRCMPPSKGSFITYTSLGRIRLPYCSSSRSIAAGIEPRWNGTLTACATVLPLASQTTAEKSIPSRTTVECAVRQIVVAISSAIEASALPTIWSVTGSIRALVAIAAPFQDERAGGGVPSGRPAGRDDNGGVVLVDEQRARLGRAANRRTRPHRHYGAVDPASGAVRGRGGRLELKGARRCGLAERRESQRADFDRRAGTVLDAVEPLVLVLEARAQRTQQRVVDRPRPQLDLDLPALAAVAEVGRAYPLDRAPRERTRQGRLHLGEEPGDDG